MPVSPAKFDLNRCNESPLRGDKPDFWPVSKNNTGSLPLRGILPVKVSALCGDANPRRRTTSSAWINIGNDKGASSWVGSATDNTQASPLTFTT